MIIQAHIKTETKNIYSSDFNSFALSKDCIKKSLGHFTC